MDASLTCGMSIIISLIVIWLYVCLAPALPDWGDHDGGLRQMPRRFALIIANGRYEDSNLPPLSTPTGDVRALAGILDDPELGGFTEVGILVDEGLRSVRKAVSQLFKHRAKDDLALLYFSGHGLRDERGRLCLAVRDTEVDDLHATALQASFITEAMDLSYCEWEVLVLDCCNSGAVVAGSKDGLHAMEAGLAFRGNEMGRAILTATDTVHYAWEGSRFKGRPAQSLFTSYLVEGIRTGAAMPHGGGNGIGLEDAFDYAREQVLRHATGQNPQKWFFRLPGEVILTGPRPATGGSASGRDVAALAGATRETEHWISRLEARLGEPGHAPGAVVELRRMQEAGSAAIAIRIAGILARHFEDLADAALSRGEAPEASGLYQRALAYLEPGNARLLALRLRLRAKLWRSTVTPSLPGFLTRPSIQRIALAILLVVGAPLIGMLIAWPFGPDAPDHHIINSIGMEFVFLSSGTFVMGSEHPKEYPAHQVSLSRPFYLGRYEVTQKQWYEVMGTRPSRYAGDDLPVERVSWLQVREFIRKLNRREGVSLYRLPTEAEWEYGCRAGTTGDYAGALEKMGWYADNADHGTHPVGGKKPNAWGLYDMHGNVLEWVEDRYEQTQPYPAGPVTDPTGATIGARRIIRGGSLVNSDSYCRCAFHNSERRDRQQFYLGFRLARSLE